MIHHNKIYFHKIKFGKIYKSIKSGQVLSGKEVKNLENKACKIFKHKYAIAVSSGYAALRLAFSQIKKNRKCNIGLPAYCCVAIPNAIMSLNYKLRPFDLQKDTFLPSISTKYLHNLDAIVFVNTFGNNMVPRSFPKKKLEIIEDITHGFDKLTCNKKSKITKIVSLHGTKLISSFEGGIILTNDKKKYNNFKFNRYYSDKPLSSLRQNDQMSEVEAIVAQNSLDNLKRNVLNRKRIFQYYIKEFQKYLNLKDFNNLRKLNKDREIFYRFIISSKKIMFLRKKLRNMGIIVEKPITPWIEDLKNYPTSKYYFENILSIPFHNLLQKKHVNKVVKAIHKLNNENFN